MQLPQASLPSRARDPNIGLCKKLVTDPFHDSCAQIIGLYTPCDRLKGLETEEDSGGISSLLIGALVNTNFGENLMFNFDIIHLPLEIRILFTVNSGKKPYGYFEASS